MLDRSNLLPYQHRSTGFIKDHEACALWVDMGLGKTVSTLTAFSDLSASFDACHMLVVAPLRVARKVWTDEIQKWAHVNHLTAIPAVGSAAQRWKALKTRADIHLVTRDCVPWLAAQFVNMKSRKQVRRFPWDMIVADESQSFKHQSSQRYEGMRVLRRMTRRFVELTGTPASNGYQDLWAQMYLLDRGQRLGAAQGDFYDRWFTPEITTENYTKWILKEGADVQIQNAVADIVLSLRAEDYLDLAPLRNNYIRVELPPAARKLYRTLARKFIAEHGGNTINAVNAAVLSGKLLQLANGAVYHDREGNWTHVHDEKLFALRELLEDVNGPVLIGYLFTHDKERLLAAVRKWFPRRRWEVLDGISTEQDWDKGLVDGLLIHPKGGGHGLNLQLSGSETLILFGLTNDRDLYDQLAGRLFGGHRRGKNGVRHIIVADDTHDDDLIELLRAKGQMEYGLKSALARLSATL